MVAGLLLAMVAALAPATGCHDIDLSRVLGASCDPSSPCLAGYLCELGRCRWPCQADADCSEGACLEAQDDLGAGVCTLSDELGCATTGCPLGLVCADGNVCRTACSATGTCWSDKICRLGACYDTLQGTGGQGGI